MPIYDCGSPDCEECQKVFGPDRSKAVATYHARERYYARLATRTHTGPFPRDDDVYTSADFEQSIRQ